MEKYENYKDSGVDWIGDIPEHWGQGKLKNFCSLKGRIGWNGLRSDEFQQLSYAYLVTGQDFTSDSIDWSRCYQIDQVRYEEDPFIQLANGDILITKDGTIGKIATVKNLDKPACLNSGIFVMKQTRGVFSQDYLYWLLVSDMLKEYNKYTSSGTTILHLYQNVFERMPLVVPPIDEQEGMASFLASECSKIDSLIATQQKRVELLKELRQSVITKAVTKGLNPNAKMKDSGVEWIGEVPEHWKVVDLKYMWSSYKSGPFGSALITEKLLPEGSILVYTPEHIAKHSICLENNLFLPESRRNEMSQFLVSAGDILVPIVGTLGRAMIVDSNMQEGIINQRLSKFKVDESVIEKDYLLLLISDTTLYKQFIDANSRGSIIVNLTKEILGNIPIILPPIEEQRRIVGSVKEQMTKIDSMIKSVQRKCTLLKEYKQSLISEVVTGKRKVC